MGLCTLWMDLGGTLGLHGCVGPVKGLREDMVALGVKFSSKSLRVPPQWAGMPMLVWGEPQRSGRPTPWALGSGAWPPEHCSSGFRPRVTIPGPMLGCSQGVGRPPHPVC